MTDQPGNGRDGGPARIGGRRCPICGKPAVAEARPFCSRRCSDVDLSRWLGGAYRIPVVPTESEDEDVQEGPDGGPKIGRP